MIPFVVTMFLLAVLAISTGRLIRVRRRLREQKEAGLRCVRCGYDVGHQDVPRCPECGAAIGFRKTFAELGVEEGEVLEHKRRREVKSGTDELRDSNKGNCDARIHRA